MATQPHTTTAPAFSRPSASQTDITALVAALKSGNVAGAMAALNLAGAK